jgi:hypothetical protein
MSSHIDSQNEQRVGHISSNTEGCQGKEGTDRRTTGCFGFRGRKWQESGDSCIKRSFMIRADHQIAFG